MTKKKTFSVNEKYQFCQFSLQIQVMQIWCYVKKYPVVDNTTDGLRNVDVLLREIEN